MNRSSNTRKIFCIILLLILAADMVFIFYNSSEDADKSGGRSGEVTEVIVSTCYSGYKELSVAEKKKVLSKADPVVRELAHMTEFIPLGFSLSALLFAIYQPKGRKTGKLSLISLGCGALYALSDEIHQLFVDGRGFQLFDIFMDSCGCTIGIIISLVIYDIFNKHTEKRRGKTSDLI